MDRPITSTFLYVFGRRSFLVIGGQTGPVYCANMESHVVLCTISYDGAQPAVFSVSKVCSSNDAFKTTIYIGALTNSWKQKEPFPLPKTPQKSVFQLSKNFWLGIGGSK